MIGEVDEDRKAQAALAEGPQVGERYRYFTGGEVEVVCRSVAEASLEQIVTYRDAKGHVWSRLLSRWLRPIDSGQPRYTRIEGGGR